MIIPTDMKLCIMVNSDTHYNILDNELFQQNCFFFKRCYCGLKEEQKKGSRSEFYLGKPRTSYGN